MKKCDSCCYPDIFAKMTEWHGDGTITTKDRFGLMSRVTCVDVDEMQEVMDSIAGQIGMPLDDILIQAQKSTGKAIYSMLPLKYIKHVPRNRFARPQAVMKLVVRAARDEVAALGFGVMKLVEYKAGEFMTLEYENACLVPRTVGGCLGFYETVESMSGATADYRVEDGNLLLTMKPGGAVPLAEGRLYLEEFRPSPGPVTYERCRECGAPLPLARELEWDLDKGEIRNRHTGRREAIIAVQSINAIEREFEKELGGEFGDMLYEAQKKVALDRLAGEDVGQDEGFWKGYLNSLALRGLGYPQDFESGPSSASVSIESAYNQELYAAQIAGALERISGKPSSIDWKHRGADRSSYTIST